ncbi:MAG: RagB/SusD family nutrient uptake outer membrane protein [Bacteroidaceae bacterium]|nr:RagB/SusD family nutrient uptake outer membrane protein [Bacteroidaceae bacterium]
MKLKNIIPAALIALVALTASSCEDMFKVDSKIVLYDYENTLDRATDTVYSVLGIIKNLQKIADRSVILGEVRGDLVATSDHANRDLAELYRYDFQNLSKSNRYNNPTDYYAVINNCNYFLAHADTAYTRNRKNVFLREYVAVLSYRAWTYLQLAQVYGDVYFTKDPILSGDQADKSKLQKLNIKQIADTLLIDFEDRFLDLATPNYGDLGGETTGSGDKSATHTSTQFFIPPRIIMGDLALWSGQYGKAAKYYHDYLSENTNKLVTTGTASVSWFSNEWIYLDPQGDTYSSTFGSNAKPICYIPMEIDEYNGVVSELPKIFNSLEENDYWYQLTRSKGLTSLSTRQDYCYHWISLTDKLAGDFIDSCQYMTNKYDQEIELRRGDLRLQSILTTKTRTTDEYTSSNLSLVEQKLIKINPEKICLYRNDVVYLRLAEALNRAGCPKTAFAVLKSGLCDAVIKEIGATALSEIERLKAIGIDYTDYLEDNKQVHNFVIKNISENNDGFIRVKIDLEGNTVNQYKVSRTIDGATISDKVNSHIASGNTMGIHSRGCGDADYDKRYTIENKLAKMGIITAGLDSTALVDASILAVEEYLIDEMGLETCFEGYRFGDLMRISMHRATTGVYDTDFLAKRVASRGTATMEDDNYSAKDDALYGRLLDSKNWFLPLIGE